MSFYTALLGVHALAPAKEFCFSIPCTFMLKTEISVNTLLLDNKRLFFFFLAKQHKILAC